MIRSIQPIIQGHVSFSPAALPIESASQRLHRLLRLEHFGTPINQELLLRAEKEAQMEARQVA